MAITSRHTIKEYYFSKKLREVKALIAEGKPIINLGIGSPDLAPHDSVIGAIKTASEHDGAFKYQGYKGSEELRNAIASYYQKNYGVALNPENEILPLIGSKEGIGFISQTYLSPDDAVLLPNPGYPTYTSATQIAEGECIYYELLEENDFYAQEEALEALVKPNVKLLWTNYPNMPTGQAANTTHFEMLVGFAKKHNILLCHDNPYSHILNESPVSILSITGAKDVALELNSLSKSHNLAGLRFGMMVGAKHLLEPVFTVYSNYTSGMFYGTQQAAIKAMELDSFWFSGINNIYAKRQALIYELLEKLCCPISRSNEGLFVWSKIPDNFSSSDAFCDYLLYEKDIFVTPGHIFGSAGEGYVRLSLCAKEKQIKTAIKRII